MTERGPGLSGGFPRNGGKLTIEHAGRTFHAKPDGPAFALYLDGVEGDIGDLLEPSLWAHLQALAAGDEPLPDPEPPQPTEAQTAPATLGDLEDEHLLTVPEAAEVLRVSASTVRREMDTGALVWIRVGPARRFIRGEDLRRYVRGRRSRD